MKDGIKKTTIYKSNEGVIYAHQLISQAIQEIDVAMHRLEGQERDAAANILRAAEKLYEAAAYASFAAVSMRNLVYKRGVLLCSVCDAPHQIGDCHERTGGR